jgi:hypothetical protein
VIRNSTFTHNDVDRGEGGVGDAGDRGSNGGDAGAAIFSLNGLLSVENATISDNFATGSDNQAGGGVVVVGFPLVTNVPAKALFTLHNTILSRNGSNDCLLKALWMNGSGNLILNNNGCAGVAVSADPHLAPLALDRRSTVGTPTMALPSDSPAVDAADDSRFFRQTSGEWHVHKVHTVTLSFRIAKQTADLTLTNDVGNADRCWRFVYLYRADNAGPDDADDVVFSDVTGRCDFQFLQLDVRRVYGFRERALTWTSS